MKVRVAHASLQFSDSDRQHTADIEKIFNRLQNKRVAWITGTEAGPGAGNTGEELLRVGREAGYVMWVPSQTDNGVKRFSDAWIGVRKDLIKGRMERGFIPVIPGSGQLADEIGTNKKWAPKGLAHVEFESTVEALGHVSVGAAHYLTRGREPGTDFWDWNRKLGKEIGDWAKEQGKGPALVFYGGDQNMRDDKNNLPEGDTFFGEPLTSMWDETKSWENTGHGNIDVIASFNRDKRVKALSIDAKPDRRFDLHTDHFYVEGTFQIEPAKTR